MTNSTNPNKETKFNANLTNLILLFSCFAFFTFGCKQNNENSAIKSEPKPILVNLPALINKSPKEVEKIIGKPKNIYPIEDYSDAKIGEGRKYNLPTLGGKAFKDDDYTLTIDYYQGKSVNLYAYFPIQQEEPEEFGRRCGFVLKGKNPIEVLPGIVKWSGNINGITFLNVILDRNYGTDTKNAFYACECETKKIPRYR